MAEAKARKGVASAREDEGDDGIAEARCEEEVTVAEADAATATKAFDLELSTERIVVFKFLFTLRVIRSAPFKELKRLRTLSVVCPFCLYVCSFRRRELNSSSLSECGDFGDCFRKKVIEWEGGCCIGKKHKTKPSQADRRRILRAKAAAITDSMHTHTLGIAIYNTRSELFVR